MASSCVPTIFEPVEYDGTMLLDGGILNNLPIEPLIGQCDKLIGIYVNSISTEPTGLSMKNLPDRTFHLAISQRETAKAAQCQLYIEPPGMNRFGMFETNQAEEIYQYAYEYTKGMKAEVETFIAS